MKPFNLKPAKNALDRIWSKLVKERDDYKCQKCGDYICELESAHIFGRGKKSVRWTLSNGVTLCKWTCHRQWAEVKKTEFRDWALARLMPEERDYLIRESEHIVSVNQGFVEERQAILRAEEAIAGIPAANSGQHENEPTERDRTPPGMRLPSTNLAGPRQK